MGLKLQINGVTDFLPIKNVVEIQKHGCSGDFNDIVERFAGVISDPGVGVSEAGEDGRHELARVGVALAAQGDRGRRQADEPALARVRVRGHREILKNEQSSLTIPRTVE